ncbi:MAG: tetratricopeptide repeat protein, partial [Candidatus Nitrosotenuis sp.]
MKRIIPLLLVFIPLAACQPAEKAKANSKIHFELAREYLMAGNSDKAVAEADAALKADEGNTAAAFLKADVLAKGGRHDEALQVVEKAAVKLGPQDAYLKEYWLGMLSFHKGDMEKALEHFRLCAAANAAFADNYSMIGQTCAKMGNARQAVEAYEKWTSVEPSSERAWSQYGMALLGAHDLDKAREALDKALAINPKSGLVHNYLGALAVERHQPKEAEEFFRKSVSLDPHNQFAHLNLAQLLMLGGRHKDALDPLTKVLEIQPDNQFALRS